MGRARDLAARRFVAHQYFRHPHRKWVPHPPYRLGPCLRRTGKLRPVDFSVAVAASRAVLGFGDVSRGNNTFRLVPATSASIESALRDSRVCALEIGRAHV